MNIQAITSRVQHTRTTHIRIHFLSQLPTIHRLLENLEIKIAYSRHKISSRHSNNPTMTLLAAIVMKMKMILNRLHLTTMMVKMMRVLKALSLTTK